MDSLDEGGGGSEIGCVVDFVFEELYRKGKKNRVVNDRVLAHREAGGGVMRKWRNSQCQ